ncbi:MAG: S8 family serine peptidase, partial [Bacteroidetes bacterium]|nr:S8 family serine peptidase [Bacteroidota bacterium]
NWIAALEWADSIGVDVTTTSLSYLDYDPPFQSYTWEDMDGNTALITIAADLAVKLGIVVVNSASNSGFNPNHNTLGAPADGDSVITVGAVGSDGERSGFSSVGPTVDGRIKPDLMAMGSGVYVARSSSPTSYGNSSGTSFSCPILAGAAALVLSVDPTLTPMEVLELFRQTASQSNNPDRLMGWGIINTLDAIELIPVPVELTLFSGRYINGSVQLE